MLAVANSLVGQVLTGSLFLKVKQNSILQKQVINKSVRMIFGLYATQGILLCKN